MSVSETMDCNDRDVSICAKHFQAIIDGRIKDSVLNEDWLISIHVFNKL